MAIENRPELREVAYQLRAKRSGKHCCLVAPVAQPEALWRLERQHQRPAPTTATDSAGARWPVGVSRLPAEKAQIKAEGNPLEQQLARPRRWPRKWKSAGRATRCARMSWAGKPDDVDRCCWRLPVLIREQMNTLVARGVRYDLALATCKTPMPTFASRHQGVHLSRIKVWRLIFPALKPESI